MKYTTMFAIIHWNNGVTITINLPHYISFSMSTISHKAFEVHIRHTIICNDCIEIFPQQSLDTTVLMACHTT